MGTKRPLEEDFSEIFFKHSKFLDSYIISPPNAVVSVNAQPKVCNIQLDQAFECGSALASAVEKNSNGSEPVSLVNSCCNDESTLEPANFPRYVELSIPRQSPEPHVDPCVILMNCSSRKEVPIGPEHQAEVPPWNPDTYCSSTSSERVSLEIIREHRLMGTRIVSFPDLNDLPVDCVGVRRGRTDCSCIDMGSMRCVDQHVKEAREKLLQTIGDEKFSELGFRDMGEEVASQWTPNDERLFHKTILCNPKSQCQDFWNRLRDIFQNRTMMELVSYYFNVFMLKRRAVQNRSFVLEIDSDADDEEWRHTHQDQSKSLPSVDDMEHADLHAQNGICHLATQEVDEEDKFFGQHDFEDDVRWVDDFWPNLKNTDRNAGSSGENGLSECVSSKHNDVHDGM